LNLDNDVFFVGHVSPAELHGLYKLARAVVYPSRFEGWGLPVLEAFEAGVPIACASVTSLSEQAGDAAVLFDPEETRDIADAIRVVWSDQQRRDELVAKGRKRASGISWSRTARTFRALYRSLARRLLSDEDRSLLVAARATLMPAAGFPRDSG
jgi:glycosyltransferase involved in cell wall biosynthesis